MYKRRLDNYLNLMSVHGQNTHLVSQLISSVNTIEDERTLKAINKQFSK